MPITITMPALSPTMEEGTLTAWMVGEGDTVAAGDVLCEIETDKATMEVEAVDSGAIGKLLVAAGAEGVKVNAPIAVLLEEGEDAAALKDYVVEAGAAPDAEAGAGAKTSPPPAAPPKPAAPPAASADGGGRIFASPLARRLAESKGLDLNAIRGSGPRGRIVRRDIDQAPVGAPAAGQAPASMPVMAGAYPPLTDDYEEIRLNAMRKTIARRLTESKQTTPHFYLTVDIELDRLLAARKQLNRRAEGYRISVNDFIIRAAALALLQHPEVNAQYTETAILRHRKVDMSVAVAVEGGLVTPVIRDAAGKGLRAISEIANELATRAREGKLTPEDYQGGTFTISNLGMYGVDQFVAVINPPQAAILAVGAGRPKPVARDGELAVATVMTATLSADHRAYGGVEGARFLETLKGFLEDPVTMLL